MTIPIIEGLGASIPNQEKNSTPSKRYRLNNGTTLVDLSQGVRKGLSRFTLPAFAIGSTILEIACGSAAPQQQTTNPEQLRPTATAVGIGGDVKSEDPRVQELTEKILKGQAKEDEILEFNEKVKAQAQATAQAGNLPKEAPTPEVKVAPVEIFPKEMDPYIEIIDLLNAKKQHVFIVGIKGLPKDEMGNNKEVPISAPIKGGLRRATNDPNYISVQDLNDLTLLGFSFNGFKPDPEQEVQPGNKIGILKNTGFREKRFGDKEYIATISVSAKDPLTGQWDLEKTNEMINEMIREFFPRAPIVSAEYNPNQASNAPQIKQMVEFADEKPAGLK